MKLFDDNNLGMGEPRIPPASALEVDPFLDSSEEESQAEPLSIAYSSTRVLPDSILRVRRVHGVVKPDRSVLAESFKMLRNQVLQRMRNDGFNLLAVTSPRAIEGKSLTALNLALTIAAEYDSAVLLVDADFSGHGLQALFGFEGMPGFSDHLSSGIPIPDLLINPGVPRFVMLPAGQQSGLNSAELLSTKAAQQLIREMRERYADRFIVVDLPPLLDTADALAFLPQVQTTLLVVEEHTTSIRDMEDMSNLLAPFNLIGTVMSQAREVEKAPKSSRGRAGKRAPWYRRWFGAKA